MSSVLDKIKTYKLEEVALRKQTHPLSMIQTKACQAPAPRGFAKALKHASKTGYGLIAEIKKASPSKGLIRTDFDPPMLAQAYEEGGASCLSILTDTPSFQGHDSYLTEVHQASTLPCLRKDFMYDTYQIAEARALHADCILLIMASLSDSQAQELEAAAFEWGMDVLIEVHDQPELERALLHLKSELIGINNRNLHTFEVDIKTTYDLAALIDDQRLVISESGLFTPQDLSALAQHNIRNFLIGESLMRQKDVGAALKKLLAAPYLSNKVL